ncbi:MAG TPA: hypothetical protein VFM88_07580 [Vicinamibacteria bacterium]|nr:hypothetical protein [Vicinamibacteria bacterium]
MGEPGRGFPWEAVYWAITFLCLACTGLFYVAPRGSFAGAALHGLSLEFEQNLATTWEGFCFLLVSLLALGRAGRAWRAPPAWPWLGVAILAAGLSLDELGSIHERADLLFEPIGLDTEMVALLPFAVPAVALAVFTLARFWQGGERRRALRLLLALGLLGSVVLLEKLEHSIRTPPGLAPFRGVLEEGIEMAGVFVLLGLVLERRAPLASSAPLGAALHRVFAPAALVTVLALPALVYVTAATRRMQRGRGVPAAWVPFALLALVALAALALRRARQGGHRALLLVGLGAALLAADAIIVFQRLESGRAIRSGALQDTLLPALLALALLVPALRERGGARVLVPLLALTPVYWMPLTRYGGFAVGSVQALGLLFVLVQGLEASGEPRDARPTAAPPPA